PPYAVQTELFKHDDREKAASRHRAARQPMGARTSDEPPAEAGDDGGQERQQRDGDQHRGVHGGAGQPFSVLRSSTLMLRRSLNSTTRIARPVADAAAAPVTPRTPH